MRRGAQRPPRHEPIAGDGRPPRRAQAPRRRDARAGGACQAPSDVALRDHRRRSRAHRAGRARRATRGRRACRVSRSARAGGGDRAARRCTLFAMPSTEEAFGVAYIEAMAGGVPAIGCRGEPGPEEIAAAGDGFVLVPPGDIERLTQRIDELLSDPQRLREASIRARETVAANFSWERCGEQTRWPPTSTLLSMKPRPVRHRPRAGLPRRRVRALARARERRVRTVRRTPQARRRIDSRRVCRSPTATCASTSLYALAASGRYRAVVCPTGGRVALPATWAGARRARVPLILWASLWAHPRSAAHALSYPALQRLYRSAPTPSSPMARTSAPMCARVAPNAYTSRRRRSTTPSGARPR